jgi:hypothetical protein
MKGNFSLIIMKQNYEMKVTFNTKFNNVHECFRSIEGKTRRDRIKKENLGKKITTKN